MSVLGIQRRMMELGRVRLGEKGAKGEPRKRDTFRFTSASRALLEAVAAQYGGTVAAWQGAPEEGYFEVGTDATALEIIIPPVFSSVDGQPTAPYSQFYEQWSGGGCLRRCDGVTESLAGKPCPCMTAVEKEGEDARACKITTRFSFMLPHLPGLGVWRIETHGWNAAVELPGTLDILMMAAAEQKFIPAVLRIDHRTKKVPGQPPNRFVVPVIELPGVTVNQLVAGDVPNALTPLPIASRDRPALPTGDNGLPTDPAFENTTTDASPMGESPALPDLRVTALEAQLLGLAEELGVRQKTEDLINRHADQHVDDPDKHLAWLGRQVGAAERKLAARDTTGDKAAEVAQPQFPIPAGAVPHEDQG